MTGLEGAGVAGELLSWIGFLLGVPLLLVGSALRSAERALVAIEIVIVQDGYTPWARWFGDGDFHQRPLRLEEFVKLAGKVSCTGYINPRDPSQMRLERHRQATRACRAMGTAFVVIGLAGFILSILPMVLS